MNRNTFLTLGLLAVFVLSACTPSAPASPPTPTIAAEPAAPAPESAPEAEAPVVAPAPEADAPVVEEEPPAEAPVIVVTPRGNDLEATDPSTVNLASGKPQLIEFFAFW